MKALLVRVGIDKSYGKWNAPIDPRSGRFVYVPIDEQRTTRFRPGYERRYDELVPSLRDYCGEFGLDLYRDLTFPQDLVGCPMHLDPDFECLTYGDYYEPRRRGSSIMDRIDKDDLLVFYAGLRNVRDLRGRLIYALIGLFAVQEVVPAASVFADRWRENAHTRRDPEHIRETTIIFRAKKELSGRLERAIPIGERRDRAYRVKRDILDAWGDLSVQDGYIQRNRVPPSFLDPERFYSWLRKQNILLLQRNN